MTRDQADEGSGLQGEQEVKYWGAREQIAIET